LAAHVKTGTAFSVPAPTIAVLQGKKQAHGLHCSHVLFKE
jgi:hypothetical protein